VREWAVISVLLHELCCNALWNWCCSIRFLNLPWSQEPCTGFWKRLMVYHYKILTHFSGRSWSKSSPPLCSRPPAPPLDCWFPALKLQSPSSHRSPFCQRVFQCVLPHPLMLKCNPPLGVLPEGLSLISANNLHIHLLLCIKHLDMTTSPGKDHKQDSTSTHYNLWGEGTRLNSNPVSRSYMTYSTW
jgi:hypothetical protein